MAYTFYIVVPPIPASDKEAWEWLWENLHKEPSFIKPKKIELEDLRPEFRRLYEQVVVQFPCICDLPDEREDEGVWCAGPLIGEFVGQIATLGLIFPKVATALPAIIGTALSQGIAVFDDQTNVIHRPVNCETLSLVSQIRKPSQPNRWWEFWK